MSVDTTKHKEGNVSEMEIVQIPVKDLVIDLPVSDANVAQKKASLEGVGMVQPVTVWSNNGQYRIIDGFHRVMAAGLLGWETVPCVVRDCSEEAFWDARIQSAKQHADISDERLRAWIVECWKASRWGGDQSLVKDSEPGIARVLRAVCDSGIYEHSLRLSSEGETLTAKQQDLYEWLQNRAKDWGVTTYDVVNTVVDAFLTSYEKEHLYRGLYIAGKVGIRDAGEVLEVIRAHENGYRGGRDVRPNDVAAWREDPPEERTSLGTFVDARRDQEAQAKEKFRKAAEAERRKREEAYRQTPEYRAGQQQMVRRLLMARYDALDAFVEENAATLTEMPDGPDLLAAQAEWALQKIAEMWPGAERDDGKVPAILAENVRLRAELAKEHDARLKAEGAMASMAGSTEKITQRRPDVMAWSSAIVEGLA